MDTIYNKAGWLDVPRIAQEYPDALLYVILGARRIGKTYGVLKYHIENFDRPIAYLRHTRQQLDIVCSGQNSPYLPVCTDMGIDTDFKPDGGVYSCFEVLERDSKGNPVEYGRQLAQGASVFATRGLASGRFSAIVFDEFIPERGSIIRKHSGYNLKSAWQTMSALQDTPKMWLLANSNDLNNDILSEFGLIPTIEEMSANGDYIKNLGDILIINAYNSPISAELAQTALGRILNTGDYGGMAFSNEWTNNNFDNVCRLSADRLREYSVGLVIGNLIIYGHKSLPKYHVRQVKKKRPDRVPYWEVTPDIVSKIRQELPIAIWGAHDGTFTFDSFDTKRKYFDIITGGNGTWQI